MPLNIEDDGAERLSGVVRPERASRNSHVDVADGLPVIRVPAGSPAITVAMVTRALDDD